VQRKNAKKPGRRKIMLEVQIIKTSCIGLDLIGKTITHRTKGEGIIVGYTSITGEPFAFFYNDQHVNDRVCCFDHKEII
jgi:hypothetical protein